MADRRVIIYPAIVWLSPEEYANSNGWLAIQIRELVEITKRVGDKL